VIVAALVVWPPAQNLLDGIGRGCRDRHRVEVVEQDAGEVPLAFLQWLDERGYRLLIWICIVSHGLSLMPGDGEMAQRHACRLLESAF
jgi:hypothetical protein